MSSITIEEAANYLKSKGIDAVEGAGILVVPASSPEEIIDAAVRIKKLLDECGYHKSWIIDPYYYIHHEMKINEVKGDNYEFNEE